MSDLLAAMASRLGLDLAETEARSRALLPWSLIATSISSGLEKPSVFKVAPTSKAWGVHAIGLGCTLELATFSFLSLSFSTAMLMKPLMSLVEDLFEVVANSLNCFLLIQDHGELLVVDHLGFTSILIEAYQIFEEVDVGDVIVHDRVLFILMLIAVVVKVGGASPASLLAILFMLLVIQTITKHFLDCSLDLTEVDAAIRDHFEALLLVLAETTLSKDQVTQKVAPSRSGQEVKALLPKFGEGRFLVGHEHGQAHAAVSLASEDGILKGLFKAVVLQVFMGALNHGHNLSMAGVGGDLIDGEVG